MSKNEYEGRDEDDLGEALRIGHRIAELRDKAGMRNQDIAVALGLSENAAKKIVSGENTLGFVKLAKLAAALGVTPNEIFGEVSEAVPSELWAAVQGSYEMLGLSPDEAHALAEIVRELVSEPLADVQNLSRADARKVLATSASRKFVKSKQIRPGRA
jgi:transcriptional regulator with XRE-family HTH domain